MTEESILLGCMLVDPAYVDKALQAGLKPSSIEDHALSLSYKAMLELRTGGQEVSLAGLYVKLGTSCPMDALTEAEGAAGTGLSFKDALRKVLWDSKKRALKPAVAGLLNELEYMGSHVDAELRIDEIKGIASDLCHSTDLTVKEVAADALQDARNAIDGVKPKGATVITGLKSFDDKITPILDHEYVVVGARTSTGKSSFMAQMAGINEARGLKVVYFTLETSSKSVIKQIAAQRARVNLRLLGSEFRDVQQRYLKEIERLSNSKSLMVFDGDLTLEKIEARCRLLATTFKPDVVFLDYLGLIGVGNVMDAYQRMSFASKRMIPLRKSTGCAMVVAAQLNRGPEKDDRQPTRTDFRDAGGIEEDAHRIIAIHRPSKDRNGMAQSLDQSEYDYELLQLKLRDGPLAYAQCKFNAPHTFFYE